MAHKIYPGFNALEDKIPLCQLNNIENKSNNGINIENIMSDNQINKRRPISVITNFSNKEIIKNNTTFIGQIETIQSPVKSLVSKKSYLEEEVNRLNNNERSLALVDFNDSVIKSGLNSQLNDELTRNTVIEEKDLMPEIVLTQQHRRVNSITEEINSSLMKKKILNNEIKFSKINDDSPIYLRELSSSPTNSM